MSTLPSGRGPWLAVGLGALIVAAAFVVSPGLFTIDEMIYLISVDAFADRLSLTVDNGFGTYRSDDLRLWFMVEGPNGLTPQYPPGLTVAGAPFYALLGTRGLFVLNALAAAGSLLLTYRLAIALYKDQAIAATSVVILFFATFFVEYAFGIWPHALSVFFVLAALLFAVQSIHHSGRKARILAALSGVAIGLGFLFRSDAVLILPVVGAAVILYSARPMQAILAGTLGLLPGIAAAALFNLYKFGSANPLSYGRPASGGGDDLRGHIAAGIVVLVLLAGLWICRNLAWKPKWRGPMLLGAILLLIAGFLIPTTGHLIKSYAHGAYVLIVDMTQSNDGRQGVLRSDTGTVSFWGVAKKALAQSMPWLGILAVLVMRRWRTEYRQGHLIALIAVAVWTMPFILKAWHGGFSSNMRYFLPIVPVLAVIVAAIWIELKELAGRPGMTGPAGIIAGIAIVFVWTIHAPTGWAGAHQVLSTYGFFALTLIAVIAGLPFMPDRLYARLLRPCLATCFGIAMMLGLVADNMVAQQRRAENNHASTVFTQLPGPALLYSNTESYAFQVQRPDGLLGIPSRIGYEIDVELFHKVLVDGYRVFMQRETAEALVNQSDLLEFDEITMDDLRIAEVTFRKDR